MNRIVLSLIGSSLVMATPFLNAAERGMNSSNARTILESWPKEAKKQTK